MLQETSPVFSSSPCHNIHYTRRRHGILISTAAFLALAARDNFPSGVSSDLLNKYVNFAGAVQIDSYKFGKVAY